jgi:hypothetical protein
MCLKASAFVSPFFFCVPIHFSSLIVLSYDLVTAAIHDEDDSLILLGVI